MAVTQALTLTQQSQSIVNNYSIVKLLWTSTQSGDSFNSYTRTAYYWVSINGGAETKYSVSYTLPKNATKTIAEVNITVPHKSDGTGSISVRTWMDTDISAGVITKNASLTLKTIPRMSTVAVSNGTLGVQQTLKVTKQDDSFTHTIVWTCGDKQGIVCQKSSAKELKWTQPLECAEVNTTGDTVAVRFYVNTYAPGVEAAIGTTFTNATYTIPDEYAPYFNITKTDDALGGGFPWVQGQSKLKLVISGAASSYGAYITGYKTEFDGKTYTSDSFVSGAIVNSGNVPIKISVTDSRGRTTTVTDSIYVELYQSPKITALAAVRSDSNGNADDDGEYLRVDFSFDGFDLESTNVFKCTVKAKKASAASFGEVWHGSFDTSDTHSCVFAADPASSYDILLTVADTFNSVELAAVGASVKKVFSALKQDGDVVGWAFGKSAELPGVFDLGWQARFNDGVLHSVLPADTDLNTLLTPKTYMLLSANSYTNTPETGIGMFLEIVGIKGTSLIQRCSIFDKAGHREYERIYYTSNGWEDWKCVRGDFVLEQGEKDGWTYRKWNSGTAECWKIYEYSTTINTAFGSLYCGNAAPRVNYPFAFVQKPVETVTLQSGSTQAFLYVEASGYGVNGTSASARYNVFRPGAMTAAQTFYLSFHVVGKWK